MTAGAGNGDKEDAPGPAMHRANCKRVEHGAGPALTHTHKTLIMNCNVK
jgi:hypothetical protein